jgi:hypothetical protein
MRNRNDRRIASLAPLLGAAMACVVLLLCACRRPPAEQVIRDSIAAMQAAGDKQDLDGVMVPLADDFAGHDDDNEVNFDVKQVKQFLTILKMQQGGAVHATLGPISVALQGTDNATADFTMLVTGGQGLIPRDGQTEQVRTGWRRDGSKWQLVSAEWKQAGAAK